MSENLIAQELACQNHEQSVDIFSNLKMPFQVLLHPNVLYFLTVRLFLSLYVRKTPS